MMKPHFTFGTKAETLASLTSQLVLSKLLSQYYFSVQLWRDKPELIMQNIVDRFGDKPLAIRSSAVGEDDESNTMAGAYDSILNVDAGKTLDLNNAIEKVISSYPGNPLDQVLVQPMIEKVALSGVVMTHDIETGAPYYVISYDDETGRTDTITSGQGISKTVLIYREYEPVLIESARVRTILNAVHELERICGSIPLDIEFALTPDGEIYIFQVRRIALHKTWHPVTERRTSRKLTFIENFIRQRSTRRNNLFGERTLLGVMTDWNPAEMLGATARPLAISLYRHLVTQHIWRKARQQMGYRVLPAAELMVIIDHHPYIDVRCSFNSFLPESLDDVISEKLINAWLNRLDLHPEYHDKVEFEIAHTCFEIDFENSFTKRFPGLLSQEEFQQYQAALLGLTNQLLDTSEQGNLQQSLVKVNSLALLQQARLKTDLDNVVDPLQRAGELLDECQQMGTLPFACLARHGFIAEALLRSLVSAGALSSQRVESLKHSIHTITSDLVSDFQQATQDSQSLMAFMKRYGHLRPGTYDITSLRYDECRDMFNAQTSTTEKKQSKTEFEFTRDEQQRIDKLFEENALALTAEKLHLYITLAVKGRELGKFVFTRNLSDALHCMTRWGEENGLSREDVSYLDWQEINASSLSPILDYQDRHFLDLAGTAEKSLRSALPLRLGYLLRDARDVYIIPLSRYEPNFVTTKSVTGETVQLDAKSSASQSLFNKIVCIRNADPGFDWIFTKGICGLITQYGGANSHMAIRCAEFGIPAAIGCGEQTFNRMVNANEVLLNCNNRTLLPLHHD